MNRITRERLKSFILLILLLTSIIQVGILWSYQNHGFPISFFSGIFGGQNSPTAASSEEFFKPFRFTVSDGDGSYWMMYPKDSTYTKVWQDIKNNYLPKLFSGSRAEQSSEQYSEEDWGNLVKKKSFFLDFNTDIKADLLSAFLNIDSSSIKELSGVYKIIILPWEDVNNNVIFYITDGQRINKYTLPITSKDMSRDDYQKIFDNLEQSDQRQYCTINGLDPAKKTDTYSSVGQDIFFARGSMFNDYYTLYSYVPDSLKIKTSNIKEIDALENSLLDDEKDFYDFAVSSYDNSIVMKDMNNTYRIHNDGLLEYKYVSAADDQEKLQVSKAFQNAVDFISKIKQLVQGNGIVLSGIDTDSKDYVEFTFDYMVNNVPVVADYGLTGNDGQVLHNAITVRATSSRVINAWCILKKFDTGTITDKYNVNFPDFLSNQFKDYKNLANDKKFFIRNVNISYVILSAGDKQTLQPEWVIYASDGKYFEIPARKKGGD